MNSNKTTLGEVNAVIEKTIEGLKEQIQNARTKDDVSALTEKIDMAKHYMQAIEIKIQSADLPQEKLNKLSAGLGVKRIELDDLSEQLEEKAKKLQATPAKKATEWKTAAKPAKAGFFPQEPKAKQDEPKKPTPRPWVKGK